MPVGFVGPALQGASLLSRFGIPLLQSAGISAGTAGIGALINAAAKTPSNTPSPNRRANVGSNRYSGVVGSIPPSANGESYRRAELRLADAARAGGGGGGGGNAGYSVPNFRPFGGTPEERAQAAETSRIAQLTAQDPELKRYEEARLKAVAPGATPEQVQSAEDIGMQIWAQKYGKPGGLASQVKPGQAGYDVIQGTMAGQAASQGLGYQLPQQMIFTPPPGVNSPQGLPAVESIGPSATYGPQGIDIDPEMQKKFQALLNQVKS